MQSIKEKSHIDLNIIPREWIDEIYGHIVASLENNISKEDYYKSGSIRLNKISTEMRIKLQFYNFINDIEDILSNIDLIVSDLNILKASPYYFQDTPYKRFYLLLRTFFYEFYRIKEKHKSILMAMEKWKYIDKNKIKNINNVFYALFEDTIALRNMLVHHNVIWTEGHTELALLFAAENTDHKLLKEDSREEVTWNKLLPELVNHYCEIFQEQSNKVIEYVEALLRELLVIIMAKTA